MKAQSVSSPQENGVRAGKTTPRSGTVAADQLLGGNGAMSEIARSRQPFAEIELFLSEGKYDDVKLFLARRLEQNPSDRETKLYSLLVSTIIHGPVPYEEEIDGLRSLADLSDIEKDVVRRLFILGFKSAEKEGRQDQAWAYQRLLRRLLLNQPLDHSIPKASARALPTNRPPSGVVSDTPTSVEDDDSDWLRESAMLPQKLIGILKEISWICLTRCRRALRLSDTAISLRKIIPITKEMYWVCLNYCRRIPETTWKAKVPLQRALIGATVGLLIIPLHYFLSAQRHLKSPPSDTSAAPSPSMTHSGPTLTNVALSENSDNSETLKRERVRNMVAGQLSGLRRAYSERIQKNPNLMGTLVLKMKMDAAGNIVKAEDMASRLPDPEFIKLVFAEVRNWKFAKADLGAGEFTLPLLFVPDDMDPRTIVRWEQTLNSSEADAKALFPVQITASSRGEEDRKPSVAPEQKPAEQKIPQTVLEVATKLRKSEAPPRHAIDYKTRRIAPLRQEPRFAAAPTENIGPGTAISVLETKGDWLKVKTRPSGSVGYVRKEYVIAASAPQ